MPTDKITARENLKATVEGDELVIRCKITPDAIERELSKSGKSVMVASTGGFLPIADGLTLNMNLTRKA